MCSRRHWTFRLEGGDLLSCLVLIWLAVVAMSIIYLSSLLPNVPGTSQWPAPVNTSSTPLTASSLRSLSRSFLLIQSISQQALLMFTFMRHRPLSHSLRAGHRYRAKPSVCL
jgi:hypothetical protein